MSALTALKHFRDVLSRWPRDLLRPELSFGRKILSQKELQLAPEEKPITSPSLADIKSELEQANALYSLLENRYANKYKLTKHLLEPRSSPTYYADLLRELDEAPKRSWLNRKLNSWKGFLRFS